MVAESMLDAEHTKDGLQMITSKKAPETFKFFPVEVGFQISVAPLYIDDGIVCRDKLGHLKAANSEHISFDGFFSALYERELLELIPDERITLEVSVMGAGYIELWHHDGSGEETLHSIEEVFSPGEFSSVSLPFQLSKAEPKIGRWHFVLRSKYNSELILESASWGVEGVHLQECRPEFIICTFKREEQVSRNITQLNEILKTAGYEFKITVVDNAKTLVKEGRWGDSVNLIQQRNLGGAGGFGRGILEAIKNESTTHVVLLDDDADIEPVSILRMLNLMRLSGRSDLFFGGMQLDAFSPTKLADAGSFWVPEKFEKVRARTSASDLTANSSKCALSNRYSTNFNGWWLFGGSADGFRKFGMPLPCFVHLDDVEYGVRISQSGGKTLTIPGVAIWHEPYYAKLEGWFTYYNIRNELIRLCLQSKSSPGTLSLLARLRNRQRRLLMSNQYGAAALVALAVDHFLEGPDLFLKRDPEDIHSIVMKVYAEYNKNYVRRDSGALLGSYRTSSPKKGIKSILSKVTLYGHLLPNSKLKQGMVFFENRDAVDHRALGREREWGYFDPQMPYVHCFALDKSLFWRCVKAMYGSELKFLKSMKNISKRWKAEADRMITSEFWSSIDFN